MEMFWRGLMALGLVCALGMGCKEEAPPVDPCVEYQQSIAKGCKYCTNMGGVGAEVRECMTACKRTLGLEVPEGCPKD